MTNRPDTLTQTNQVKKTRKKTTLLNDANQRQDQQRFHTEENQCFEDRNKINEYLDANKQMILLDCFKKKISEG